MGLRKRPYNENKGGGKSSTPRKSSGTAKSGSSDRKSTPYKSDKSGGYAKRTFKRDSGESFSDKPARFSKDTPAKRSYRKPTEGGKSSGERPSRFSKDTPAKRSYRKPTEGGSYSERPSRFSKDAPAKRSYRKSDEGSSYGDKPKRFSKDAPVKRSYRKSEEGSSYSDKPGRFSKDAPAKRSYRKSGEEGDRKPSFRGNRREEGDRKPYTRGGERSTRTGRSSYGENEFSSEKPRYSKSGKPYMVRGAKARDMKAKSEEMIEAATPEIVRLNRFISNAGICSRREADDLIAAGLVAVNGEVVTEMGYKVKPGDEVRYNNERLSWEKKVYLLMNKPKDTITTSDDPEGRRIIMDLIKEPRLPRVYPVGRLDRNTTGVIILTNDGELAQRLTHPKYNVTKIYKATLNKSFAGKDLHELSNNGVELEDGPIKPDAIGIPSASEKDTVLVQIHSGRNRIIHRMFEALGYLVDKLDRLEFAGIEKKGLDRGEWRHLDVKEIKKLKKLVQLK